MLQVSVLEVCSWLRLFGCVGTTCEYNRVLELIQRIYLGAPCQSSVFVIKITWRKAMAEFEFLRAEQFVMGVFAPLHGNHQKAKI